MILVVDVADPSISLLFDEFVRPIIRILQSIRFEVSNVHLSKFYEIPDDTTVIILCGTALADLWYTRIPCPANLINWKGPILGICAGMQILLGIDGGNMVSELDIGMTDIRLTPEGERDPIMKGRKAISGYSLHQKTNIIPENWEILGNSNDVYNIPQIVRSICQKKYGVLFHPEVRNEWIIERFAQNFI